VARARDDGAVFTGCPKPSTRERDAIRLGAIAGMRAAGLGVTLATDDPAMFDTDIAQAYERVFPQPDVDGLAQVCAAGVQACWLDDDRKARLRARVDAALAVLRRPEP
jgi:adenosine deaminase